MSDFLDVEDCVNVKCIEKDELSNDDTEERLSEKNNKNSGGFFISRIKKKINLDGVTMVAQKKPRVFNNIPWVEKYRPNNLKEIFGQDRVKKIFQDCVKDPTKTIPHMVLFGPPGTGKTSIVLAAAKELFGPVFYRKRVIEFDASDDRGIGVVKEKIKKRAESIVGEVKNSKYPCPPFKIIVLDEADALTNDAQSALRIIIEKNSKHTRFILICNYISQITPQIISRCTRFRFNSIDNNSIKERLVYIAKKENLYDKLDNTAIDTIITSCNGDMRRSITLLQNCVIISELKKKVKKKHILEFLGTMNENEMKKHLNNCISVKETIITAKKIIGLGYPVLSILNVFINIITKNNKLNDQQKSSLMLNIAKTEKKLIEGADEYLQLLYCLTEYMKQIKE